MNKNGIKAVVSLPNLICVILLSLMAMTLSACSGKAAHPPRVGEYGTKLVDSVRLTKEKVETINTGEIQSFLNSDNSMNMDINFIGNQEQNPYRFVMVVKGHAKEDGMVDLGLMYGTRREGGGFNPNFILDEDDSNYDAGESVMLVIGSDPFSVGKSKERYDVLAMLNKRKNIDIDSIELQIWNGEGSKFNSTYYIGFGAVLLWVLFIIFRVVSRR